MIANDHGGELLRVRLAAAGRATRAGVAAVRPGAWPLARRAMTESRDRIARAVR
jgi:hypothetical protein